MQSSLHVLATVEHVLLGVQGTDKKGMTRPGNAMHQFWYVTKLTGSGRADFLTGEGGGMIRDQTREGFNESCASCSLTRLEATCCYVTSSTSKANVVKFNQPIATFRRFVVTF